MSKHHQSNRADKDLTVRYREYCAVRQLPCWICTLDIDYTIPSADSHPDSFQRDHYYPASTHPELYSDWDNFRPSHARCNSARGNKMQTGGLGTVIAPWWGAETEAQMIDRLSAADYERPLRQGPGGT